MKTIEGWKAEAEALRVELMEALKVIREKSKLIESMGIVSAGLGDPHYDVRTSIASRKTGAPKQSILDVIEKGNGLFSKLSEDVLQIQKN